MRETYDLLKFPPFFHEFSNYITNGRRTKWKSIFLIEDGIYKNLGWDEMTCHFLTQSWIVRVACDDNSSLFSLSSYEWILENDYPHLSASDSQKIQEGGGAVGVDFMSIRLSVRTNVWHTASWCYDEIKSQHQTNLQRNITSASQFIFYGKMRIIISRILKFVINNWVHLKKSFSKYGHW